MAGIWKRNRDNGPVTLSGGFLRMLHHSCKSCTLQQVQEAIGSIDHRKFPSLQVHTLAARDNGEGLVEISYTCAVCSSLRAKVVVDGSVDLVLELLDVQAYAHRTHFCGKSHV